MELHISSYCFLVSSVEGLSFCLLGRGLTDLQKKYKIKYGIADGRVHSMDFSKEECPQW